MRFRPSTCGYTLIELSVVLVTIGLLIGGIIVAQDLIAAARVNAQISQLNKYNTAAGTFQLKYNGLPGDLKATQAAQISVFATRAGTVGRGDGNGLIEEGGVAGGTEPSGEIVLFWNDLSAANLIDGIFQGVDCPNGGPCTGSPPTSLGQIIPPAKIRDGSYVYVYGDTNVNYFMILGLPLILNPWGVFSGGNGYGLTPEEAFQIDSKIDDGLPTTGIVQSTAYWGTTPMHAGFADTASAGKCGNTDTSPTSYNNAAAAFANQVVCSISVTTRF